MCASEKFRSRCTLSYACWMDFLILFFEAMPRLTNSTFSSFPIFLFWMHWFCLGITLFCLHFTDTIHFGAISCHFYLYLPPIGFSLPFLFRVQTGMQSWIFPDTVACATVSDFCLLKECIFIRSFALNYKMLVKLLFHMYSYFCDKFISHFTYNNVFQVFICWIHKSSECLNVYRNLCFAFLKRTMQVMNYTLNFVCD